MVARTRYTPISPEARAEEIAEALLGTSDSLDEHASEDECGDRTFRRELDARVRRCESCAEWVTRLSVDALGYCFECRGGEL